MLLIGLMGRSRAGKDSVAAALLVALSDVGLRTEILRLSQPLKDAARALYGFTEQQMETDAKERADPRYGIAPRAAINGLCAHMMAAHGLRFFTDHFYERLAARPPPLAPDVVVIPDVRFLHDVAEIRARGGFVVKVQRDLKAAGYALHAWENLMDRVAADVTVENKGSLPDLWRAAVAEVLPAAALRLPPPIVPPILAGHVTFAPAPAPPPGA